MEVFRLSFMVTAIPSEKTTVSWERLKDVDVLFEGSTGIVMAARRPAPTE